MYVWVFFYINPPPRSKVLIFQAFPNSFQRQAKIQHQPFFFLSETTQQYDLRQTHLFDPNPNPNAARESRQQGTLLLLASGPNIVWESTQLFKSGDWTPAEKNQYLAGEADWHCFAMFLRNRKVLLSVNLELIYTNISQLYIYDSSYAPPIEPTNTLRRIGNFPYLNQARNMISAWDKKGLRIDEIRIGGGGNIGTMRACRPMTLRWMGELVTRVLQGEPMHWNDWEEIRR